jgi:hypothetical protein
MIPIRFIKAAPTTYVIQFRNGKVRREGPGLAFFYYAPTSTIVTVPLASADAPFAFQEATADFQTITVQGQLTYRVAQPKRIAEVLDLSVASNGVYRTDDYRKLVERLVHATQTSMREEMQKLTLGQALMGSGVLSGAVLTRLRAADVVSRLGIEILNLSILSIRATPEMSKALEAEAREALQRRSDEAIYARRNNAVEQERRIKESELNTEIAVEEKQRQIRETRMAADIALEQQRAVLMDQRVENEKKESDSRAYAMEATIKPVREVDWRTLMMLFPQNIDSRTTIALAFQEMASNAQKIGELNISPDLLNSLLAARPEIAKAPIASKGK